MAISKPIKQAALAGNARSTTGVMPLYRADGPSLRINSRNTSRIPLYAPAGAVCKRLFKTSAGEEKKMEELEKFRLKTWVIGRNALLRSKMLLKFYLNVEKENI